MFELTIAQALIASIALIGGTIIIADLFRTKVNHVHNNMHLKQSDVVYALEQFLAGLNEQKIAMLVLTGFKEMMDVVNAGTPVKKVTPKKKKGFEVTEKNAEAVFSKTQKALKKKRQYDDSPEAKMKRRNRMRTYRAKRRASLKK